MSLAEDFMRDHFKRSNRISLTALKKVRNMCNINTSQIFLMSNGQVHPDVRMDLEQQSKYLDALLQDEEEDQEDEQFYSEGDSGKSGGDGGGDAPG